jgi:Uma2 family endonuclease
MTATVVDGRGHVVRLPTTLSELSAFRAWVRELPDDGPRVHLSRGALWIDMSPQDYFHHLSPVAAINARLTLLADELDLGRYHPDGGWITHPEVGLSTEPDGFLVRWDTFRSGDARWVERPDGKGPIELVGRGDMVLEVVSDTSVQKDRVELLRDYAAAGFHEYWLVDSRSEVLEFRLYVLDHGAYREEPVDQEGWRWSAVWGRSVRLVRDVDRLGAARHRLEVRAP